MLNWPYIKTQSVPRSEHHLGYKKKTSQLIMYREIVTVCSEIHTKHTNTLCGQNVGFVNVKPGGADSNHWALKGQCRV